MEYITSYLKNETKEFERIYVGLDHRASGFSNTTLYPAVKFVTEYHIEYRERKPDKQWERKYYYFQNFEEAKGMIEKLTSLFTTHEYRIAVLFKEEILRNVIYYS